ncbi:hypothetical protein [Paenibacillus massiliensis]|uniref:hypothetical protein n=1 Tax=Paenibacillus massiliensis TaxID=225917 RepID=UPI00037EB353|nr:hypothetical protein [Paenibacillus massiliensis]
MKKKSLALLLSGFALGVTASFGGSAYAAVKQYILTEFNSPVVVNGTLYKDQTNPILNYNGKTYIPLSKIGDLTGVPYRWNADKKQVEIGNATSVSASNSASSSDVDIYTIDDGRIRNTDAMIAEEQAIKDFNKNNQVLVESESGVYPSNGIKVFRAYDKSGKLIKEYTDSDDSNLIIAETMPGSTIPPKISEGWLASELLEDAYDYDVIVEGNDLIVKTGPFVANTKEFARLTLDESIINGTSGKATVNGIGVTKYKNSYYFNINSLKQAGLI